MFMADKKIREIELSIKHTSAENAYRRMIFVQIIKMHAYYTSICTNFYNDELIKYVCFIFLLILYREPIYCKNDFFQCRRNSEHQHETYNRVENFIAQKLWGKVPEEKATLSLGFYILGQIRVYVCGGPTTQDACSVLDLQ